MYICVCVFVLVLHTKDTSRLMVPPEQAAKVIKVIELAYCSNQKKAAIPF